MIFADVDGSDLSLRQVGFSEIRPATMPSEDLPTFFFVRHPACAPLFPTALACPARSELLLISLSSMRLVLVTGRPLVVRLVVLQLHTLKRSVATLTWLPTVKPKAFRFSPSSSPLKAP